MARRRKRYMAAANKGKAGQVLVNNLLAARSAAKKKRAKEEERSAKASKRKADRAAKAREKLARLLENDEKERELRAARASMRLTEKMEKYRNRLKADFERKNIIFCDEVADVIIEKSLSASYTLAEMSKNYVEGNERKINDSSIEAIVRAEVSNHLLDSDLSRYEDTPDFITIIKTLCDLEPTNASALKETDVLVKYLDKVESTEKHLRDRVDVNKKIERALMKVRKDLSMLPEDLNKLEEYVDDDQGLTLTPDGLKKSKCFIDGVNNKKSFRKKIDEELAVLIG